MPERFQIRLNPRSGEPLYRQVARAVREAVESGRLKPGERLLSVTDLARQLRVNRATVVAAFQELERAGLVSAQVGRGTFVAEAPPPAARPESSAGRPRRAGDFLAAGLRELLSMKRPPGTINLAAGVPDPRLVPEGTIERLAERALAKDPRRLLEIGGPAGLPELREAVAARLRRRGTDVSADQVLVTSGSQQAVSLLACWALDEGRPVLCETPTFAGIPGAFALVGNRVESVPWEEEALGLDRVPRERGLLYCAPDHHNPTGRSLSVASRQDVARWSERTGSIVAVDEIFRDLRFRGEERPSLYDLLPPGRRLLVGSISKSFATGLRIGYVVADPALVAALVPFKRLLDLGGPALTQALAAAFLADGYDAHLGRMRAAYRERMDAAGEALARKMPAGTTFTRPDGGFLLWGPMPPGASAIQLYLRALEKGVAISPGPAHDVDGRYANCFRLSVAQTGPAEIRKGVEVLASVVRDLASVDAAAGLGVSP